MATKSLVTAKTVISAVDPDEQSKWQERTDALQEWMDKNPDTCEACAECPDIIARAYEYEQALASIIQAMIETRATGEEI